MEHILKLFLDEKAANESNLSSKLIEHQEEVILSFGGLTNMIELCLTNPNASQHVDTDSKQFISLKNMLEIQTNSIDKKTDKKNIDIDDHDSYNISDNTNTNTNTNIMNNNNTNTILDNQNNNSNTLSPQTGQLQACTVMTATQYDKNLAIIDCDPRNNLLFTMIKNGNTAMFLYNQIKSKTTLAIFLCACCISVILELLKSYLELFRTPASISGMIMHSMAILYCIAALSIGNKEIVILIVHTFDFWFKVYNTILLITAIYVQSHYVRRDNTVFSIFRSDDVLAGQVMFCIAFFTIFMCLFLLDGIGLPLKLKRVWIIMFVAGGIIICMDVYFSEQDFLWNPFNFENSQISFKSIILSSYANVILFAGKPLFSDLMRYLKHKYTQVVLLKRQR